jgi:uncharacterized membrane protein
MPVAPISLGELRHRLPQLLYRALDRGLGRLPKLPFQPPAWPLAAATVRWVSWRTMAAAVLLGGIVHICAIFAAALSPTGEAYRLLAAKLPVNSMVVEPLQAPGRQILPFLLPDALYAVCRYDLSGGPVSVTASVLNAGWALSLHTPDGNNYYVLPGQRTRRTQVAFVLVPSKPDVLPLPRHEGAEDTEITSPTREGLIVLRAPLRGLAWTAETAAILQRASCKPARP